MIQEHRTSESEMYLAEVERGLASLVVSDREEMMNELRVHISELVSEGGEETVRETLGDPKLYASELIKASGFEVALTKSRFQRINKLPRWVKALSGATVAVLLTWTVFVSGVTVHTWRLFVNTEQSKSPSSISENFFVVKNYVGLPVNDALSSLQTDGVSICSPSKIFEGSVDNLVVTSQSPVSGETVSSGGQCVWLYVGPSGVLPSLMPSN